MSRRALGLSVGIVGLLVAVLAAVADQIGVGSHPGIGPQQTVGVLLGAVVLITGLVIWYRSRGPA